MLLSEQWLSYKYFYYTLKNKFKEHWFNWENKATPTKVKEIIVEVPVDSDWNYALDRQEKIARKYETLEGLKSSLMEQLDALRSYNVEF